MFYIVETAQQLQELEELTDKDVFIHIISSNFRFHPIKTYTVGIYLKPDDCKGVFIPIQHDDGFHIEKARVCELLNKFKKKFTVDRKELLYHFNLENVVDVSIQHNLKFHRSLEWSTEDLTIDWYYNRFETKHNLNQIIPIPILVRYCENLYEKIGKHCKDYNVSGLEFYNSTASKVFFLLEQNGIGIDTEQFKRIYNPTNPEFNITGNTVYSSYKLTNVTTRPTNTYNSINFSAIPKKGDYRKVYKPRNDYFVEFDFDGYHLRLIAEQIGYKLSDESAHIQIARKLFNTETVSEEEYAKAKQINFHAIYGKVPKQHENIVFFREIKKYISRLWESYRENGYIENPISKMQFKSSLEDMNPSKLMNYMVQSLETANNITILKDILKYLHGKTSTATLYTYDSIIIDFNKEDGKQTLEDIQEIMECSKKYPVKFKFNTNLVL